MKTTILAAMLAALLAPAAAAQVDPLHSNGTLPLKLPSDGTLPLKLSGDATSVAPPADRVPTAVVITSAETAALPPTATLACQAQGPTISRHRATGTVAVDGQVYALRGICYNHQTRQMELVASRGAGLESFLAGALEEATPAQFNGRMTVTGTAAPTRYVFAVRRVGE